MHFLELSPEERRAIDWIGHRYFHGTKLLKLLWSCDTLPSDVNWDSDNHIVFYVPDNVREKIRAGFKEENFEFAGLSGEFAKKLLLFVEN